MATWLLKTEPSEFSFADLMAEKTAVWDGITNNAALAHLRAASKGDEAFIYHTGDERAVVGLARIVSSAYEDPRAPGLNGKGEPKFAVIDVRGLRRAASPVTLERIKGDGRFAEWALVRQPRLSVVPVPPEIDALIREWSGL